MKVRPALQKPDATVPAKNTVVIAGRPDLFRFLKTMHGFLH
jgi:hypothetical protein